MSNLSSPPSPLPELSPSPSPSTEWVDFEATLPDGRPATPAIVDSDGEDSDGQSDCELPSTNTSRDASPVDLHDPVVGNRLGYPCSRRVNLPHGKVIELDLGRLHEPDDVPCRHEPLSEETHREDAGPAEDFIGEEPMYYEVLVRNNCCNACRALSHSDGRDAKIHRGAVAIGSESQTDDGVAMEEVSRG
ncbi:hypothetical protein DM02DRAFT_635980 [Periconia macrospinosa]|uniref:Uncharacterized protein n=1 Tax=Periconia macrospinosa TaxID=97972 RepID=A0A2V1D1Y2_9PLEO|nr:hypothetical protein DM02DRAFT_635980 [Periconia macrospinosa]